MSSCFEPGVYVRIEELEGSHAPHPKPLLHGFDKATLYRILGTVVVDTSGEYLLWLVNNSDELYLVSNRHVRVYTRGSVSSFVDKGTPYPYHISARET